MHEVKQDEGPDSTPNDASLPYLPSSDDECDESDSMSIDHQHWSSDNDSEGVPSLPDSPPSSQQPWIGEDQVLPPAPEMKITITSVFGQTQEVHFNTPEPASVQEEVIDANSEQTNLQKGKDKEIYVKQEEGEQRSSGTNIWELFASMEETQKWMLALPRRELVILLQDLVIRTTTFAEKDQELFQQYRKFSFPTHAKSADRDQPLTRGSQCNKEKEKRSEETSRETGNGFSVFDDLDEKVKKVLAGHIDWDIASFQVGTISSAGAKDVIQHLRRWLSVLAGHYERNVQLVASMDEELHSLRTAGAYCEREVAFYKVLDSGPASTSC
ncbi:hypothetical protein BKA70DRAFT_1223111 [Coprinopsis sp. MPI-PUGE-AT-0042]|nr:hypothetical protein BKA70DRAFT_1223111 [Coprinopsis sp. MPI-PUGE-AT-0042]